MKRSKKNICIDPEYLQKQREALKRSHRVSVLFNAKEMAAIDEYCRRFKISSHSALIRQATVERVLASLDESHPTLF